MGVSGHTRRDVSASLRHASASWAAVLVLVVLVFLSTGGRSAAPRPATSAAPVIDGCGFVPDPRTAAWVNCADGGSATMGVSISFQVNVSDTSPNSMNVTFYFDYYRANMQVNPDSPIRTIQVASPAGHADTTWTYDSPNANYSLGQYWVKIEVRNDLGEYDAAQGSVLFPIYVVVNSPPYLDGLLSPNPMAQPIRPQNPIIPLVYENVTIGDLNSDPVTLSWDWGDGTSTVMTEDPPYPLALSVTHQYLASALPLNESPRYVDIPVQVWIDDGQGHNVSYNGTTEFYIDYDAPPNVRIDAPSVGSWWKVGETISMSGNVTDPEGDATSAYWDFDNRTDSTRIGDPERNVDATGTTASHAYASPGMYNITLWATDGDKLFCLNQTTCETFTTHWRRAIVPIEVRNNRPPVVGLSNVTTVIGEAALIRASVYDPDGDNMTVRWAFGDGTPDAVNYTGNSSKIAPKVFEVFQEHNYSVPGVDNYTVSVSDGSSTVTLTRQVFVQSFNLPPVILNVVLRHENATVSSNNTFRLGEHITVTLSVYDPENDTMNVSIDWADGASDRGSVDPEGSANCSLDNQTRNICTISFSHAYLDIGGTQVRNYSVVLTVSDGQVYLRANSTGGPPITLNHTKAWGLVLFITNLQAHGLGPWDWWDYSSLAFVLGLPTLLIVRFAWKVRREREEA